MKKGLTPTVFLKQIRVKSWLKNILVLFPIVFSLELFDADVLLKACILTLSFCLISSAVYVFNDINDVENDRKHDVKKNRPIAAGLISIPVAWVMMICLIALGFCAAFYAEKKAIIFLAAYVLINILYSKGLKKKVIIDCFCIAAGFVLRVMVGGTVVEAGVSGWMFLTIVALSLFMAFGKRRGELQTHGEKGTRDVLGVYDMFFLDGAVFMCAGLTMVFYSLWSISQKTNLVYTVPIVLFLIIRYLYLVFKGCSEADPTTMILSDKTMLIVSGLCGILMLVLLYDSQLSVISNLFGK